MTPSTETLTATCDAHDFDVELEARVRAAEADVVPAEEAAEPQPALDELHEFLDFLPPAQRRDYRAVAIDGRFVAEQARRRGVSKKIVSNNLMYARERLRRVAEDHGEVSQA